MDYISEVFRFGGAQPYVDVDGKKRNLSHDWENAFSPEEVTTDGGANVIDQPLLRRKWCYGRPEAYLRQGIYDIRYNVDRLGVNHQCYTPCNECPVREACQDLVIKRLDSSPAVLAAFVRVDVGVPAGMQSPFLNSAFVRLWIQFLHAIKAHGGWTNVNDARVRADNLVKGHHRVIKRRASAQATRAKMKHIRRGTVSPTTISPAFISQVDAERGRRLATLLDLRTQREVPPWIAKLSPDGCVRTADVWRARAILTKRGQKATGKAIAEMLLQQGSVRGAKLGSLTTRVCSDMKRVEKLESDHAGDPVWLPFRQAC